MVISPSLGWANCESREQRVVPHSSLPLRLAPKAESWMSVIPFLSLLIQREGRVKLQLLSAETHTDPDTARPYLHGAAGGGIVMVEARGGEERRIPQHPPPSQIAAIASLGLRARDPYLPTHDGYLRVLLRQLLVLPLQLCGGHGLPRPVQAWPPGLLSPAPHPQPHTCSWAGLSQLLQLRRRASSSTSGFPGGRKAERTQGRGDRRGRGDVLTSLPHPLVLRFTHVRPRGPACAVRLLGLWPGTTSWKKRQDGDPFRVEPDSNGRRMSAYGMDGTPRRETGDSRRSILRTSRILATQSPDSHSNRLAPVASILEACFPRCLINYLDTQDLLYTVNCQTYHIFKPFALLPFSDQKTFIVSCVLSFKE